MSTAPKPVPRVEVQPGEIEIGKPLPWPVYAPNGVLLAPAGFLVTAELRHRTIAKSGVYRDIHRLQASQSQPGMARPEEGEVVDALNELRHNIEFAQLTLAPRGEGESEVTLISEYIGKLPGQILLMSAPPLPGRFAWRDTPEGVLIRVRLLTGRSAYSFETALIRYMTLPTPMLFLRYPAEVAHQQVRNNVRVRSRLKAVAKMGPTVRVPVLVDNISGDGCGLETETVLGDVGTRFDLLLRIEVLGQAYTATLPCIIRNRRVRKGRHITGVMFTEPETSMDATLRMALEAYLYEQIVAE
jgi:hypothetical protein